MDNELYMQLFKLIITCDEIIDVLAQCNKNKMNNSKLKYDIKKLIKNLDEFNSLAKGAQVKSE